MPSKPSVAELLMTALKNAGVEPSKPPTRVPPPKLKASGALSSADRWRAFLWAVDTAQQHGADSLRGLTIALSRIVQGQTLETMLFDAREMVKPAMQPSQPFWDPEIPLDKDGNRLTDLLVRTSEPISVELADAAVFPSPWERWRMHRALGRIGAGRTDGPWKQSFNHCGIGWGPWPIVLLEQGNHSTLAGQLRGGGLLTCEESYDATPLLKAVRTDGQNWYRTDTGKRLGRVTNEAMAGIFVVGQRLAEV